MISGGSCGLNVAVILNVVLHGSDPRIDSALSMID
jgi:hypothetical protein